MQQTVQADDANPLRGIAMKIMSVVVFTAMSACVKIASAQIPPGETVFFRSLFALPVILAWLWLRGEFPSGIRTANPLGHLWRGLIGVSAMAMGFAALGILPFPDVISIGYAAPLIATILAAMFLGERIRGFRISAVVIGLTGVIIILYPKLTLVQAAPASAVETLGAMLALMGAFFAGLAQVFVRKLVMHERTAAIVFWFSVTAATLSLVTLPFGWVVPDLPLAGLLVLAGLLGGLGQILLTESYRHAETAVIASFEYTSILLALLTGYLVFSEVPSNSMLAGAALVFAAGLFIVHRERQLGIERARARKVMTPQG
jgi:drug/metabolite transporter (DMT)-like permease